jgi:hypothetical protein
MATASTAAAPSGARHALTVATRAALGLFSLGIVVQVFLAGLYIFGDGDAIETHRGLGWAVHTLGVVCFLLAVAGPRTRTAVLGTAALVILNTVQILLSGSGTTALAALHPTLALFVLGLAGFVAAQIRRDAASERAAVASR